jgi:hypothetical protein
VERVTVRQALVLYAVSDFVIGPILVGATLLGFALFIFGVAAAWHFGVPWPLAMTAVGGARVAIALGPRHAIVWALHFVR